MHTVQSSCDCHAICADRAIGEVERACEENGYVMLVTADHGNAERMIDENGKPVTKHTTFRGTSSSVCLCACVCVRDHMRVYASVCGMLHVCVRMLQVCVYV